MTLWRLDSAVARRPKQDLRLCQLSTRQGRYYHDNTYTNCFNSSSQFL